MPIKRLLAKNNFLAKTFKFKFSPSDFLQFEKLFRGYNRDDLPKETGQLEGNHFRFPDNGGISCNWDRFSKPEDVRKRKKDCKNDGCYSFTVEQARYNGKVSTCHDPNPKLDPKNYSHMELRQLLPNANQFSEPSKDRKSLKKEKDGWSKSQRMAYREHISMKLNIELEPMT